MLQPTPEQLALLTPIERFSYRFADLVVRRYKPIMRIWNSSVMYMVLWLCSRRRLHLHGLENVAPYGEDSSLILVCNHRSFYDFFVITWINFHHTRLSRRMFFPVRSTFFYDNLLGPFLNLLSSGMSMFPPIMRDRSKKSFNAFALQRVRAELLDKGSLVGFHPEGRRNKSSDPYTFLPARRGVGEVALEAEEIPIIPIFILGMTNDLPREIWRNWTAKERYPIDVVYGPPIDISDLRGAEHTPELAQRVAERCMEGISRCADQQRLSRGIERPAPDE